MDTEINKENIDSQPAQVNEKPQMMTTETETVKAPLGDIDAAKYKENIMKNKETEVITIGSGGAKKNNLQANFNRFRKQKQEQIKYKNYVAQSTKVDRKDPAFKQALREKFLETAKKYFGVPYAQRYHQPGDKHYDAPIFLDCCGLVRQIVYDLREDFGFYLDRWNQCYQFDTLPIKLEKEEMKPGDLVFYTGIYNNPKLKQQKHHMVHVEIFTGGETGEQSIGARWQKGVVKYFDSYKFESTSYHSIEYHFRSIDTWLEGVCKSFCDEHEWRSSKMQWQPGKTSIFNFDENYGEDDLNAPVFDDEDVDGQPGESAPKKEAGNNLFFVGNGNNQNLPKQVLLEKGYKEMGRGMQFSDKYRMKWTQTSTEINYMKFKEGAHMCNHISNSLKTFTNKVSCLDALQKLKIAMEKGEVESFMKYEDFQPETYRLDFVADLSAFFNSTTEGMWIIKKANSNQGRGIRLVSDVKAYKDELRVRKEETVGSSTDIFMQKMEAAAIGAKETVVMPEAAKGKIPATTDKEPEEEESKGENKKILWKNLNNLVKELPQTIAQKYIERPLLYKGKKFDIRAFMLIACTKPYLVMFNSGYVRTSLNDYVCEPDSFEKDKITHLTNCSVQKKHPNYKQLKEESVVATSLLAQYLVETGKLASIEEFDTKVLAKFREVMRLLFVTVKDRLDKKYGCFELFGFDFLLDEDLNLTFIECNTNPAIFTDTTTQAEMLPKLIADTVDVATDLHVEGATEGKQQVKEMIESGKIQKDLKLKWDVIYQEEC